jgi:hypothetical protein
MDIIMMIRIITMFFMLILFVAINSSVVSSPPAVVNCPHVADLEQKDDDGDGIDNVCDNCWKHPNLKQFDSNSNCPEPPYSSDPVCGDACEIGDSDSIVKKLILLKFLFQSK